MTPKRINEAMVCLYHVSFIGKRMKAKKSKMTSKKDIDII